MAVETGGGQGGVSRITLLISSTLIAALCLNPLKYNNLTHDDTVEFASTPENIY